MSRGRSEGRSSRSSRKKPKCSRQYLRDARSFSASRWGRWSPWRWPRAWSGDAAPARRPSRPEFNPSSSEGSRPGVGRYRDERPKRRVEREARVVVEQRRFVRLGFLLFVLLIILVLAVLLGAGGYSVRRYWSPAGSEVVETSDTTGGAGAGVAAAILALLVLILLFFGFTSWNWFGTRSGAPSTTNNPSIASPMPSSGGGGASASPSAQASPSK